MALGFKSMVLKKLFQRFFIVSLILPLEIEYKIRLDLPRLFLEIGTNIISCDFIKNDSHFRFLPILVELYGIIGDPKHIGVISCIFKLLSNILRV